MTTDKSVFATDDYVVRYGLRCFRGALLGLLLWTAVAVMIAVRATGPSIPAAIALTIGEIGLLAVCALEIWRAARRDVVFAVSQDGVYFGPCLLRGSRPGEAVPWEQVSAVELFTENAQVRGIRSSYLCVGVRARADGARLTYRRMAGWRVSRATLEAAVRQHAPSVPVLDDRRRAQATVSRAGERENA
jgi:hypothetical protein